MAGWGGLNKLIEDALARKEEERKEEEARKAWIAQRQGERDASRWKAPVVAPVAPEIPDSYYPDREIPGPYDSQASGGIPSAPISSSYQSPTVESRVEQPQVRLNSPTQVQARPMLNDLLARPRTSNWTPPTLRDLQPPQANAPQQPQGFGGMGGDATRGEYNQPNRPMVPTEPQPFGFTPDVQPQTNVFDAMGDAYKNTAAYQQAQARSETRRGNEVPGVLDSMVQAATMAKTGGPTAMIGAAMAGGLVGAANNTDIGREAIIRAQDAMDRVFEVPGAIVATEPWMNGYSPAEVVNPAVRALVDPRTAEEKKRMAAGEDTLDIMIDRFTKDVTKSQALRQRIKSQVDAGNPEANLANRNWISGVDEVETTLNQLMHRNDQADSLDQWAVALQKTNPVKAGEMMAKAQELRAMTDSEVVDMNMNPAAEFIYGWLLDPTNLGDVAIARLGLNRAGAAARSAKAAMNVSEAEALGRLGKVGDNATRMATAGANAPKVWNEVIAPFQSPAERVIDNTWLFQRTAASKAALDLDVLRDGLKVVLQDVENANDARTLLTTLATNPKQMVSGVPGLQGAKLRAMQGEDGLVRYGTGITNSDFARRLPILGTMRDQIAEMRSLQPGKPFNRQEFFAEVLTKLDDATRTVNKVKEPSALGKLASAPADIQRWVMNEIWLGLRPANMIGNALGATVMSHANDLYSLTPNSMWDDYFMKKGDIMPTLRMEEITNAKDAAKYSTQAGGQSSGIVSALADKLLGKGNRVSKAVEAGFDVSYGSREIKLPDGRAIPFSEQSFYKRAYGVPYRREFNGAIKESIYDSLVPQLWQIEGMTPEKVKNIAEWIQSTAENGSKADIAQGIRGLVARPKSAITLRELNVPPELLQPSTVRRLEQMMADSPESEAAQVLKEVKGILAEERKRAASLLTIAPTQPGITDWTDADMMNQVQHMTDTMSRDGVRAGMSGTDAQAQASEIARSYLQGQQATYDSVVGDLGNVANTPDTWSVMMDFLQDVKAIKGQARATVDELGHEAVRLGTPDAWAKKWQGTKEIYGQSAQEIAQAGEKARIGLQGTMGGGEYKPRHDRWDTIEGYVNFDEEALRRSRTISLGSPSEADMPLWKEVIDRNREYADNSFYDLFGAFQTTPSLKNLDIVRKGLQKSESMGAAVRFQLDELLDQLVAGKISKVAYARARNAAWNNYFDAVVVHNQELGKVIIKNGLLEKAGDDIKWTVDGAEYRLEARSETPGKYWGRNTTTNQLEEFTAGDKGEANPFSVPQEVVNSFNSLIDDDAIAKATAQVENDIATAPRETPRQAAPQPAQASEGEVNPERFRRDPSYQQWWESQANTPSEERLSYEEWWGARAADPHLRPLDFNEASPDMSTYNVPDAEFGGDDLPYPDMPSVPSSTPRPETSTTWRNTRGQGPSEAPYGPQPAPAPTPRSREALKAARDEASAAYTNGVEVDFQPEVTLPTSTATIPTNADIRRAASDAGVATATKDGRPTDKHLLNSVNKRLGTNVKKLDDLTDIQRMAAVDAMAKRTEEQVSKMSKAEVAKAITPPVQAAPTTPSGTANMFGDTAEDLPTISGMAQRAPKEKAFVPTDVAQTEKMFDVRPEMVSKNPKFSGKLPDEQVFTPGDMAKGEIQAAKEAREDIRKAWDRWLGGHSRAGIKADDVTGPANLRTNKSGGTRVVKPPKAKDESFPSIDSYIMRNSQGGALNLNLNAGELNDFNDVYGTTFMGRPVNNIDDVQQILQEYADLNRQIKAGEGTVAKSKQFSKMSAQEIAQETHQELVAAGFTDKEITELAKDRRSLLDIIATVRGDEPDELGMVGYDYQIPSIESMLGLRKGEPTSTIGKGIEDSRRMANNGAVQVGEIAEDAIRNINDLERTLTRRMPEILRGKPNQLTGAEGLRVVDEVTKWLPNVDNAQARAQRVGGKMADWVMLNYNDRRNFDSIMGILTPYHYFWSRMPARALTAALTKPSLVNLGYEFQRAVDLENQQADLPERLSGTLPVPFTNGTKRLTVTSPLRYALPWHSYLPNDFAGQEGVNDNDLEQWMNEYEKFGPGMNMWVQIIADLKDGKLDKDYSYALNSLMPIPGIGVPVSTAYQALTGKMPAKDGTMAKFGFGPDPWDPYRAKRAIAAMAVEQELPEGVVMMAQQIVLNQSAGKPIESYIDPELLNSGMWQRALTLAEDGIRRGSQERALQRGSSYLTTMGLHTYSEGEQEGRATTDAYYGAGYDAINNPNGSADLQKAIAAETQLGNWVSKNSETPGIDGQISALYDEAAKTGDYDAVMPKIEALQQQKAEITGEPATRPAPAVQPTSVADRLRGPYVGDGRGKNPQEQYDAQQKALSSLHWEAYKALTDTGEKAAYLRDNPVFADIYKKGIEAKGETPEDWWTGYGDKGAGTKTGTTPATSGEGNGLAPGSVSRDDFTPQQLDQYYDEYFAFNGTKDWDGQQAWLLDHPEFARLEADRVYAKEGEYPWWYDDYAAAAGVSSYTAPEHDGRVASQPTSTSDILRQPYDAPATQGGIGAAGSARSKGSKGWRDYGGGGGGGGAFSADWDAYHNAEDGRQYLIDHPEFAEEYLRFIREKDPEATAWWLEADWSADWDAYLALGDNAAKRQYMLDHPEFAEMYKGKYSAWWESEGGGARSYSSYGGGGGGGGGSYDNTRYHNARTDPRWMDRSLWDSPFQQQRQWLPYSEPTPDWLRAGDRLQADPIRKWVAPRIS